MGQWFKVPRRHQKTLVGCGAAAGIAATFNAPIAGVLFALEILLGEFGVSAFAPVVISSVIATTISRHYFGDFPAFIIPTHEIHSLWEFLIYPFLGLLCGVVAVIFVTILYKSEDILSGLKVKDYMTDILSTISENATLDQIMDMFKNTNTSYLHVVDANGHLTGIISFRDIRPILDEEIPPSLIIARDIATLELKTIVVGDNIQAALRLMISKGISQLPVIKDNKSKILVGCLREKDVISAYDNQVIQREMQ